MEGIYLYFKRLKNFFLQKPKMVLPRFSLKECTSFWDQITFNKTIKVMIKLLQISTGNSLNVFEEDESGNKLITLNSNQNKKVIKNTIWFHCATYFTQIVSFMLGVYQNGLATITGNQLLNTVYWNIVGCMGYCMLLFLEQKSLEFTSVLNTMMKIQNIHPKPYKFSLLVYSPVKILIILTPLICVVGVIFYASLITFVATDPITETLGKYSKEKFGLIFVILFQIVIRII